MDKLIRYNDGCRKFLQGPITDARNKVSGHELDNLLTMLNSMIRQQAYSPENKGLGALKNEIVNARDLAKAAVDILGIAQWLEVRAKRYINALSIIVDKANSEAAAVSGTLKQESFQLSNYLQIETECPRIVAFTIELRYNTQEMLADSRANVELVMKNS